MAGKKEKTKGKKAKDSTEQKSVENETDVKDSEVKLASKLGIGNVAELAADLELGLDTSGPIKIDIDGVEQVDTAALQVLVSFANTALSKEIAIEWLGKSEVLTSSSKTLGLHSFLEFESEDSTEELAEDDLCPVF